MESVLRAAAIYIFLLIVFRIAGNKVLGEITTFDFVLLLIISEATQQGMIANDYSLTNAFLVILTLLSLDIGLSLLKRRSRRLDHLVEGLPLVIVQNGKPLKDLMHKACVDEEDVLAAARQSQGLERMEQIKFAVLESNGGISIIPKKE
jgi:uncharacterized membrane protein YcaP (DUF421 family)